MSTTIQTKYGTAKVGSHGYYYISDNSTGNYNKLLHRLIYADANNIELPEDVIIHHKDENKLNNNINNLEIVTRAEHIRIHRPCDNVDYDKLGEKRKGIKFSKEWCENISAGKKGVKLAETAGVNMSKNKNTTGFYCISKKPCPKCKQGFSWIYQYYDENIKPRVIHSVDLLKLKDKVLKKGLKWLVINEKNARDTCNKYGYDFMELC